VIVDHVLLEPGWLPDLATRLERHQVLFVGVRCPLETVVQRELTRRDRTVGQAAAQLDVVHRAGGYDLEVDTVVLSADEAAGTIAAAVGAGFPARPFANVRPAWGRRPLPRNVRQARVPAGVNPAAGMGSCARPSAPRSHARALSPRAGR
jgi:Chloramphenicol phosphotransferase-like protein